MPLHKFLLNHIKQNYHRFRFFFVFVIISSAIGLGLFFASLPKSAITRAQTGNTYYVATNGNDSRSCSTATNINTPKGTLSNAVTCLSAGDTLYIRGGTYTGSNNTIDSEVNTVPSGTSWSNAVTIRGYPGETVTIRPPNGIHGLRLTLGAPHYLIFQDFILDYVNDTIGMVGIYLSSGAHHNRFERLEVTGAKEFGIGFSRNNGNSPFNEVINSRISNSGFPGGPITNGHGFYISTSDNLFEGNEVFNNQGYGFHLYDDAGPKFVARNVVRNNKIYNNGLHPSLGYGLVQAWGADNLIYNNLIYSNPGGILIYIDSENVGVYNNTIYSNTVAEGIALQFYQSAPIIHNNIVFANESSIVDYGGTGSPVISNNFTTDPKFINASTNDFHLQSSSPAINAGTTVSTVTTDFDGVSRPQGSAYDIGAYEFTSAPPPPPSTKFQINDRVQVTASLNVRSTPSTSGTLLGTQTTGALGTVIGGPVNANGFNWWNVNYDTGADGWSVEDFLVMSSAQSLVKAFPTAEGFGANSVGGRGGRVIEVINLNDSGPGSFRNCAEASGSRTCVFRVSGTIILQSNLGITNPFITIAGQTSPGGVQIKTASGVPTGIHFVSGSHNIIVRHLRVRMGGGTPNDIGEPLIVYGNGPETVHDAIFDHVSLEWGADSQFMAYQNFDNVTLQWSIIAEGAGSLEYPTGAGKGTHVGGWGDVDTKMRYTDHHNLYAHNQIRNPLIQRAGIFDLRNTLVYNWGGNNGGDFGHFGLNTSAKGNIINNHYIPGPNSGAPNFWLNNGGSSRERGGTKVYTSGNWGWYCQTGCADDWTEFYTLDFYDLDGSLPPADPAVFRVATPFSVLPVSTEPTANVENTVLANAGANKPSRDSVDTRIVNDVRSRTGNIANIGIGGPWPDLATGASPPPTDSDHDGMPNTWELSHGLNPNDSSDGSSFASNGYTNLENYLNELAGDPISISPPPPPTQPNYVTQGLATAPGNLTTGQSVTFAATVRNSGTGGTTISSQTRLRIDINNNGTYDVLPANQTTTGLAAGATQVENWTNAWTAQAGTHRFEVCADINNVITESNETDNCTTQTFIVSPPPTPPPSGRFFWNFGDGGFSTLQNPQHTFVNTGVYNVTLTATDNQNQSCSITKSVNIKLPNPIWKEVNPGG